MNLQHQTLQVKRYDHDRYICGLFAKNDQRDDLFTILAFNSEISLISEQTSDIMPALIRITWWQDAIDDLYNNKIRQHSLIKDLNRIIIEKKIPHELFKQLLQGRMTELHQNSPQNMEELIDFAQKTGGNLLEICGHAINIKNPIRLRKLGIAWSLIGILRSTKYNNQTNKPLLFPLNLLPNNFKIKSDDSKKIAKSIAMEAERFLNQVDYSLFRKSTASLDLIYFLSKIYLKLLKKCEYDIFSEKLSLNPVFKQLYLFYQFLKLTAR